MLGLVVALNAYHSCAVLNWAPVISHPFIPRVGIVARPLAGGSTSGIVGYPGSARAVQARW